MPFAPHEIENKKFVIALRGYQTAEVDAFLRAVAADYKAALDGAKRSLEEAAAEASEPRELVAEIERVMGSARAQAEQEAAEIRGAAERDAAEIREAVEQEAEAAYTQIARQAETLQRIESRLRQQLQALEHAVSEAKQALSTLPPVYVAEQPGPSARTAP
jgi:DivIVA domain-containing protein